MIKLKGYLKPFIIGLMVTILLLFGQAFSDLNLPNYMSDIVNVGIQQNGIEHAAPDAITEEGMMFMTSFMDDSEKQLVADNYTLVSNTDENAKGIAYSDIYPDAGNQLYVKRVVSETTSTELDRSFGVATWTFINVMKSVGTQSTSTTTVSIDNLDLTQLYQIMPMLEMLPDSTMTAAHELALSNDDSLLSQSGIVFARAFYSELGTDLSAMQTTYIATIGLYMLLIALLGGIASILVSLLSSRIASGVARNLRKDVFNKIENFSNNEFDKFSTASLITRCTNDNYPNSTVIDHWD